MTGFDSVMKLNMAIRLFILLFWSSLVIENEVVCKLIILESMLFDFQRQSQRYKCIDRVQHFTHSYHKMCHYYWQIQYTPI